MSTPPVALVASPPPSSILTLWRQTPREKKISLLLLLALGLWSVYKYLRKPSRVRSPSPPPALPESKTVSVKSASPALSSDEREGSMTSDAAADLHTAAQRYGKEYQDRMRATKAVPTAAAAARPFIGFSLADNIVEGALVVDGVFVGGPADQTGVDIDHELLSINGVPATSIDAVRELVATHCRAGQVTRMKLRKEDDGPEYEVLLWVMTADEKYRTKPYFFNTKVHAVRQSERFKQTWRAGNSPRK